MISEDAPTLTPGDLIQLFELDMTRLGGQVEYFTPSVDATSVVVTFNGVDYKPVDIIIDGIEMNAQGPLPQPKVKIANTQNALTALLYTYGDLTGALVRRIKTYTKYLDNGATPDASAHWPIDVFKVSQKSALNKTFIELTLGAAIDVEGQKLPGRQVLRNYCKRRYRIYVPENSDYDYSHAQCPYQGAAAFDINGRVVTPDKDVCGKKFHDCFLRFSNDPLPYWGFPGAGRF